MCGFDPMDKFGALTMGIKGRRMNQAVDRGHQRLLAQGADRLPQEVRRPTSRRQGQGGQGRRRHRHHRGDKEPVTFRFVGDSILFAKQKGSDQAAGKDGLEKLAKQAEGDSILGSPAFMEVYKKINTDDSLWFVVKGDSSFTADAPVKFKAAWGSVAITDGLALDASVRMNSADEAKQAAEMGNAQLGQVKGMFLKEASLSADGADLRLKASMTGEQIEQLAGMMKGMMGGMGGGGWAAAWAAVAWTPRDPWRRLVLTLRRARGWRSAAAACGKKKGAGAAETARDVTGLAAVPAGTTAVVGLDVGRLARSELVTRAV